MRKILYATEQLPGYTKACKPEFSFHRDKIFT